MEAVRPLGRGCGKRMVYRRPADLPAFRPPGLTRLLPRAIGGVVHRLEHRWVDYPEELPCVRIEEPTSVADLQSGRAEQLQGNRASTGREEHAVTGRGGRGGHKTRAFHLGQVLRDRAPERPVRLDEPTH